MIFYASNKTLGSHFKGFITIFIIGCVIYAILIYIFKDIINDSTNKYLYLIVVIIAADLVYTYYFEPKSKKKEETEVKEDFKTIETEKAIKPQVKPREPSSISSLALTDATELTLNDPDPNDFKITLDSNSNIFSSPGDSIFDSESEKPKKKSKKPSNTENNEISLTLSSID